jgi:hypothetical protein
VSNGLDRGESGFFERSNHGNTLTLMAAGWLPAIDQARSQAWSALGAGVVTMVVAAAVFTLMQKRGAGGSVCNDIVHLCCYSAAKFTAE